jgi:hypothetical protein
MTVFLFSSSVSVNKELLSNTGQQKEDTRSNLQAGKTTSRKPDDIPDSTDNLYYFKL